MKSMVLLESHLKTLKLPTFLREYERTARQCAEENKVHAEFLLCLAEMEVAERQGKATERRLGQASFPAEKELSNFDFASVPKLNKKRGGAFRLRLGGQAREPGADRSSWSG